MSSALSIPPAYPVAPMKIDLQWINFKIYELKISENYVKYLVSIVKYTEKKIWIFNNLRKKDFRLLTSCSMTNNIDIGCPVSLNCTKYCEILESTDYFVYGAILVGSSKSRVWIIKVTKYIQTMATLNQKRNIHPAILHIFLYPDKHIQFT